MSLISIYPIQLSISSFVPCHCPHNRYCRSTFYPMRAFLSLVVVATMHCVVAARSLEVSGGDADCVSSCSPCRPCPNTPSACASVNTAVTDHRAPIAIVVTTTSVPRQLCHHASATCAQTLDLSPHGPCPSCAKSMTSGSHMSVLLHGPNPP